MTRPFCGYQYFYNIFTLCPWTLTYFLKVFPHFYWFEYICFCDLGHLLNWQLSMAFLFRFTNTSCFNWFYCFPWLRTVVGTRVRIGSQHPLRVVKCDLMRLSYGWERKTEALCQSKFATIKIPFFSNAVLRCLAYIKCYSKLLITVSTDELLRAVWGLEFVNSTLFTLRMTLLLNVKWVIMLWISAFSVIVRWIVL